MNRRKPWVLMALLLFLSMFLASTCWAQSSGAANLNPELFLELDGVDCGKIGEVTGGEPFLQASAQTSSTGAASVSRLDYEDIKFSFGMDLTRYFYTSVQGYLSGRNVLHSGSIVTLDFLNREISRLSFTGGSITGLVIPVFGMTSGDVWFKLSISPTAVQRTFTPAGIPFAQARTQSFVTGLRGIGGDQGRQKFQLQIPGLENDCQRVGVIETLLPNQRSVVFPDAALSDRPKLIIVFTPLATTELFNWQEDFIVRGNNDDTKRKQGTLTHLIRSQTVSELIPTVPTFVLTFRKLGISRLAFIRYKSANLPFWRAEMDMERIEINFDGMVSRFDTTSVGTSPAQTATLKTSTSPAPAKLEPTSKVAAPIKEVAKAKLVQLLVTPNVTRMELRDSLQFKAVALYQDKTTQEVTTQVEWSSSDYSVIEVFKDGLATAKSLGKAEIFATYQGIEGQSDQIIVFDPSKVKEGRIVQIFVTPNTLTLKQKDSYQFTATALFSDKTIMDITDKVEWYAGDYTVVEVFEDGLATAKKPGKTTIFATYKEIEGESEEITVLGSK